MTPADTGTGRPPAATAEQEPPPFGAAQPPPAVSLPKGGGAVHGIGEKFTVNPATGTGSASIPLPISPGRAGFEPKFSLSYDSGAGNGIFGLGWSLGLSAISRRTDRGIPRYDDESESDVFVLAGAEDLVPVVVRRGAGFERHRQSRTGASGTRWTVRRYRPRTEGLFARIERWTDVATGISHWRTIGRDGTTSVYGRTPESRVADPRDPARVFSWLICESFDLRGNAMVYRYDAEDATGVDLQQAHERGRTPAARATQRHPKRVLYGNRAPRVDGEDLLARSDWLFELVFDYGEHDLEAPRPHDSGDWDGRPDPFSSHRSGFEVRTYGLCRRILMFHHFPAEAGVGRDCLVRSLTLGYRTTPVASQLVSVTAGAHRPKGDGTLVTRTFPKLEFGYTEARPVAGVRAVEEESVENLPAGATGEGRQLVDIDGDGLPGVLTEEGGSWFYKRNLSPLSDEPRFAPLELVGALPVGAQVAGGPQQLLDVDGDGRLEVVAFARPLAGYHEREGDGWAGFVPFDTVPVLDWEDPNLRFVDLTGDGHADVLLTSDEALTWYPSLGSTGFGAAERVAAALDEERGPRLVFADGSQSVYLADMSGDGLIDLVRVDNGEVSYWPNAGYGHFGPRVAMDSAPVFDSPDRFEQERVRLADADGSGPTDLLYLGAEGVCLYPNLGGNGWGPAQTVPAPPVTDPSAVTVTDLLGTGTACLVWSSALPGDLRQPMRYVDLMGGRKPHLLELIRNNLGAETKIEYASSTRSYARDRAEGRPWVTRLPFPVQVVDRVEVFDAISGNRFVSRHAYHHGYFDGDEREFRGFGLSEQWDTAEYADLEDASNTGSESHVPPLLTRTWFHTGAHLEGGAISRQFAAEYYAEGHGDDGLDPLTPRQHEALLLPDTVPPVDLLAPDGMRTPHTLTADEERQACRALKGSILRQETYALDGSEAERRPYLVSERSYAVELLQPSFDGAHPVFLARPRESIEAQYERALFTVTGKKVADPRVNHSLTLAVDGWGNPLRVAMVAYGRRHDDPDPDLTAADRAAQRELAVTWTDSAHTDPVDADDAYRGPLPADTAGYELLKARPAAAVAGTTNLFRFDELAEAIERASDGAHDIPYEDVQGAGATGAEPYRRLLEAARMLYRRDDLTGPLPLRKAGTMGHPFQGYRLAFTQGLIESVYRRPAAGGATEALIPDPVATLGIDGGYARGDDLRSAGSFPSTDPAGLWWLPAGRVWLSPDPADGPAAEIAKARAGFFQPRRFEDPFGGRTTVTRDVYELLVRSSEDPVGNVTSAAHDYRVLKPRLLTDPNGNRAEVLFDCAGQVAATAVMGKQGQTLGDSVAGIDPDPSDSAIAAHIADPAAAQHALLGDATTRLLYDLHAFQRTRAAAQPSPAVTCVLVRETHASDLAAGQRTGVLQRFEYSDGFGRTIQAKGLAEPGAVVEGGPRVARRWVGTGWTVFNNKGDPVRQYEPFFTATHRFELARATGISSILLYDPVGRPVATVHPNRSWEKLVLGPWSQAQWDVNDTTLVADPAADPDVGARIVLLPRDDYFPTWHGARAGGALGPEEARAAVQAAAHAGTPTVTHFDPLGRSFLTFAHNRFDRNGTIVEERYRNRTMLDLEGNRRAFVDALGRIAVSAEFGLLGGRLKETGMDSGARWVLTDAASKPLYVWDSQGRRMRTRYDAARRPTSVELHFAAGATTVVQRTEYGEGVTNDRRDNVRGRAFRTSDGAGVLTQAPYDFKGNCLKSRRQLAREYKAAPDWSQAVELEDSFEETTEYDALSRPVKTTTPDGSVVRHAYNEAGLLESVDANLRGAATVSRFVREVDYDAKGQRHSIVYGNGVTTEYTHDPLTWRLVRQRSVRGATRYQDLSFVYDAAGNVTSIADAAQQTIFFHGSVVHPNNAYTYDATYRLVDATGREHVAAGGPLPRPLPADGTALQRYRERYAYDAVGNILELAHRGEDFGSAGWRRTWHYAEASLLEPAKKGNRLSETREGGGTVERYAYDAHGCMTSMSRDLPVMGWDHADLLRSSARQVVTGGAVPETTWYAYDVEGNRIRKVTESFAAAGAQARRLKERIYASGIEVYREYGPGGAVTLERQTLPVLDDTRRVALVEMRSAGADPLPARLVRFQLEGHLASAAVELASDGSVITYEEYHPHGGTSFQGVGSQPAAPKRYRWSGRERDEESGLYRCGERYYAPRLCRWTSCDPAGTRDSPNVYVAFRNAPSRYVDPTGRENGEFDPAGSGMARRELALNIDEHLAVGEPGISPEESMRRAKDLSARSLLDQTTNSGTKGAARPVPIVKPAPLPPTSVKENPGALVSRPTLGGIKEWDELSEHITKQVEGRLKGKTAQQVKEILNEAIREELKAPKTAPGKAISDALSKQLGKSPKDLFKGKTLGKLRWKGGGGKIGKIITVVIGVVTLTSTAAEASEFEVPVPENVKEGKPMSVEDGAQIQFDASMQVAEIASVVPGGLLAAAFALGIGAAGALEIRTARKVAEWNNVSQHGGNLRMVENAWLMINPSTGEVFAIAKGVEGGPQRGTLTSLGHFDRYALLQGQYYRGGEVIQKDAAGKFWLGDIPR